VKCENDPAMIGVRNSRWYPRIFEMNDKRKHSRERIFTGKNSGRNRKIVLTLKG
jgi:hypothetical protein